MVVPAAGFEPARPAQDFGFKDRCVYQFRHAGMVDRLSYQGGFVNGVNWRSAANIRPKHG